MHAALGQHNGSLGTGYSYGYLIRLSAPDMGLYGVGWPDHRQGYGRIAGTYTVRATDSCKAAPSTLTGLVVSAMAKQIIISQDGFKVKLTQNVRLKGQSRSVAHDGVIVESALVVSDPTATDISFLGKEGQDGIELRPWVAYIRDTYSRYPQLSSASGLGRTFEMRPNFEEGRELSADSFHLEIPLEHVPLARDRTSPSAHFCDHALGGQVGELIQP